MIAPLQKSWVAWHEGREGEARTSLSEALVHQARFDAADWQAVGYLHLEMEQTVAALAALRAACRLDATLPETHLLLGVALRRADYREEAIQAFEWALELRPGWPDAVNNLAIALEESGHYEKAIALLATSLKQHPRDLDLWNELGSCLCAAQRASDALQAFRKACEIDPTFAPLRWNLATALLQAGRYEQGWQMFEERLHLLPTITAPECPAPPWEAQPLNGRTLLVWHEQGMGDTLQFARYLPALISQGARVVLRVPPELKRLFSRLRGLYQIVTPSESLPRCDYQIALLSLPRHLWNKHGSALPECLFSELPMKGNRQLQRTPLRIGIAWAGNPSHPDDSRRSLRGEVLRPLLEIPNIEWVNLQVGVSAPDGLPDPPQLKDFEDTAKLLITLDLLVSCDTAVAHLAGSLGLPTLLLLPFAADWRWGERSPTSPWYPNHQLLRQQHPGDWAGVIAAAAERLREFVFNRSPSRPPTFNQLSAKAQRPTSPEAVP